MFSIGSLIIFVYDNWWYLFSLLQRKSFLEAIHPLWVCTLSKEELMWLHFQGKYLWGMRDEGWRRRVSVCRKWILSCSWWCDIILYGLFLYFYFQFELKFPYVTWFADVFFLIFVILHLQHFRGLSFRTISSVGPHGAIIHYSPNPKTCSELDPDSIYLCDSGGQVHLSYSFIV